MCGGTGARWYRSKVASPPILLCENKSKLFGMELPRASWHSREEVVAYNSGHVNQARERQ